MGTTAHHAQISVVASRRRFRDFHGMALPFTTPRQNPSGNAVGWKQPTSLCGQYPHLITCIYDESALNWPSPHGHDGQLSADLQPSQQLSAIGGIAHGLCCATRTFSVHELTRHSRDQPLFNKATLIVY
jgi:hypothetical protein